MAEEGYIKLYRQIRHNWIWNNPEYLRAWLDLLLSAAHDDYKTIYRGELKVMERGTIHRSFTSLATAWGWSRKRVRHFIGLLERDGMVTTRVSTVDTVLTIVNYGLFQSEKIKRANQGSNKGSNEGNNGGSNEGTINNNVKNDKECIYGAPHRYKKTYAEREAERKERFKKWAQEDEREEENKNGNQEG